MGGGWCEEMTGGVRWAGTMSLPHYCSVVREWRLYCYLAFVDIIIVMCEFCIQAQRRTRTLLD
jgi:hypothetical protein